MKNIIYKPWIGEKYNESELGKILILGDSHYFLGDEDEKDFPDFTNEIIKDLKNCNYPFYRKIGKFFNEENILEIWDKVAFANAIQVPFRDAKQKPTDEDLETVENAVVREIKEETTLDITIESLLGVYSDPARDERFHTASVVYICKAYGTPKAADDAKEVYVYKIDEIPLEKLVFDHKQIILDFLETL